MVQIEQQDLNLLCYADESVKSLYGDTVANIVFNPGKVTLLRLTTRLFAPDDTLKQDTLPAFRGCHILNEYTLTLEQISPILFILSDKDTYFISDDVITIPFNPYLALSLYKGDDRVDVIFSIGGGRIKICHNDTESEEIKYIPERLIIKHFQWITRDPILQTMIES